MPSLLSQFKLTMFANLKSIIMLLGPVSLSTHAVVATPAPLHKERSPIDIGAISSLTNLNSTGLIGNSTLLAPLEPAIVSIAVPEVEGLTPAFYGGTNISDSAL